MPETTPAVSQVLHAIRYGEFDSRKLAGLAREWPELAKALAALMREHGAVPPLEWR